MPDYYIGLISGTSMDGVDAALVTFGEHTVKVRRAATYPYPEELRGWLLTIARYPAHAAIDDIGALDHWTGECFRDAARSLIADAGVHAAAVKAIGSHGQTIRHRPSGEHPFTWQIGNPAIIATGTGITTVADFRRADIALGGQGAPLVPPFHEWLFRSEDMDRCVLNIGGIANVTVLPAGGGVTGFDTGPGNTLLDVWIREHRDKPFDDAGNWAASGTPDEKLLGAMLADPYFDRAPPKSTGFEHFNGEWLAGFDVAARRPADVQATLCELTAVSIANALQSHAPKTRELLVCGGGVHNGYLLRRLLEHLPDLEIHSSGEFGLDPDAVEACAFAWLAKRALERKPGNAPGVTGAARPAVLGAVYPAS